MRAPRCRRSGTPSRRAPSVSVCRSWSASDVEPVHLDLIDQRRTRNAELVRRPRAIPPVKLKRLLDVRALHLGERQRLVTPVAPPTPPSPGPAPVRREGLKADLAPPARPDHCPLADVTHLPHVPPPR